VRAPRAEAADASRGNRLRRTNCPGLLQTRFARRYYGKELLSRPAARMARFAAFDASSDEAVCTSRAALVSVSGVSDDSMFDDASVTDGRSGAAGPASVWSIGCVDPRDEGERQYARSCRTSEANPGTAYCGAAGRVAAHSGYGTTLDGRRKRSTRTNPSRECNRGPRRKRRRGWITGLVRSDLIVG
jgi:hypothetical protein